MVATSYRFDSGRRQYPFWIAFSNYVCVAQLDRALGYGPRCREFESSRARIMTSEAYVSEVFLALSQVLGGFFAQNT